MLKRTLNNFQRLIAKSSFIVRVILLIRNQCNAIVKYYLASSSESDKNGENFIVDKLSPKCSNILDIGANKGEWTEYFLERNSSVNAILYDPSVQAYNYLKEKFKNTKNVQIIKKAVSDSPGNATFYEEPDLGETSSLVGSFSNKQSKTTVVEVSTIDLELERQNIQKVDYLKIDAEGYDFHVLKGATESLSKRKITYLQFEYNMPWAYAGTTLINAINFLESHNYEVFLLQTGGLYKFNYKRYGDFFEYANFFATPSENIESIKPLIRGER
jgi:FkbM family methyltransferase